MRVLITRPIPEVGIIRLVEAGHDFVAAAQDGPMAAEEFRARLPEFDAAITMLSDRVDAALLDRCPRLRMIAQFAVGIDNIDLSVCTARGIAVSNTPEVLTDATADLAWALLLGAARHVVVGDRMVREGRWAGWGPLQLLGAHVTGKTLGIIGPGRIGQAIARRGQGFEMRILYHGRRDVAEFEARTGAQRRTVEELLQESDFVVLACPLTPETRHLIDARRLALMKRTAVLVNVARGPVVHEEALVEALRERRIEAAGLDVYEFEPRVHEGLLALENVLLLPHLGSATTETRRRMAELCAENLACFAEGRRPPTILNAEVLSR